MSIAFLSDKLSVADLTALKTLAGIDQRRDGELKIVANPGSGLPPILYRYNAASSVTEDSPRVVSPNDSTGRWFAVGDFNIWDDRHTVINQGTDISANYTVTESDRGKLFKVMATATITLPSNLTKKIRVEIILTANVTITFAADTGATVSGITTLNTIWQKVELLHLGSGSWIVC